MAVCLAVPALAGAQGGGYDTDPTREQFVAKADPRCKKANAKSNREFKPVEKLVKKGKYKAAAREPHPRREVPAEALQAARQDRPPARRREDDRQVAEGLKAGSKTWVGAGKDLKKKRFKAVGAGLDEAEAQFKKANKKVKRFGFRYCA